MVRRARTATVRTEGALVAAIWFTGLGATTSGASREWIPTVSLLLALTTMAMLYLPLRHGRRRVPRTASAHRVTITTAALLGVMLLVSISSSFETTWWTPPVLAATSWVVLAISVRLRPLAISSWAPWLEAEKRLTREPIPRLGRTMKRSADLVGACIILVAISPLLVLTSFLIWFEDRGPILFWQERVGRDGRSFRMAKFRSMVPDAEDRRDELMIRNQRNGPLFKIRHDPRITRLGRVIRAHSIDELPQLLNVILGSMSLVGPRPALIDEHDAFDETHRSFRSCVKPGMTGLWQAEARSDPDFQRYRELDLTYIRTWSVALDLRILLATFTEVVVTAVATPLSFFGVHASGGESLELALTPRPLDAHAKSTNGVVVALADVHHRYRDDVPASTSA